MNSDNCLHLCSAFVFLIMSLSWPWQNGSTKATKVGLLILGTLNTIYALRPLLPDVH